MDSVRRSLEGGWRTKTAKAGRFTLVVVILLFTWLTIAWLVGRVAVGP